MGYRWDVVIAGGGIVGSKRSSCWWSTPRAETSRAAVGWPAWALTHDGRLVDDFSFHAADRVLHVRNAPSPAATSSLAIAAAIVEKAQEALQVALTRP